MFLYTIIKYKKLIKYNKGDMTRCYKCRQKLGKNNYIKVVTERSYVFFYECNTDECKQYTIEKKIHKKIKNLKKRY